MNSFHKVRKYNILRKPNIDFKITNLDKGNTQIA
jgi:hypothetical protein